MRFGHRMVNNEHRMILRLFVLTQYHRVTDGRTDTTLIAKTRYVMPCQKCRRSNRLFDVENIQVKELGKRAGARNKACKMRRRQNTA